MGACSAKDKKTDKEDWEEEENYIVQTYSNTQIKKKQENCLDQYPDTNLLQQNDQQVDLLPPLSNGSFKEVFDLKQDIIKIRNSSNILPSVIKAKNTKTGQYQILRQYFDQNKARKMMKIQNQLNHPNITKITEYYESQEMEYHIYIVAISEDMESSYIPDHITNTENYNEHICAVIVKQILSAVECCHKNNILHRNINLQSFSFVKEDSTDIKLNDFELAKELNDGFNGEFLYGNFENSYQVYKAPEVKETKYGFKSDVWSCGVLAFHVLCGMENQHDLNMDFKLSDYIEKPSFQALSDLGKQFLQKLLQEDQDKRCSIQEALADDWILKYSEKSIESSLPKLTLTQENYNNLNNKFQLKQSILDFIKTNIYQQSEHSKLLEEFKKLDVNKNGKLSKEEVIQGYQQKNLNISQEELEQIFVEFKKQTETEDEEIPYKQWIKLAINREKQVQKQNLEDVFKLLDKDGDGQLSLEEIMPLFQNQEHKDSSLCQRLIKEFDGDKDQKLSLEEFIKILEYYK